MTGALGPALTLGQMLDRAAARDPSQMRGYYVVESFPLTGSGKVQKFQQKAYAVEKDTLKAPL